MTISHFHKFICEIESSFSICTFSSMGSFVTEKSSSIGLNNLLSNLGLDFSSIGENQNILQPLIASKGGKVVFFKYYSWLNKLSFLKLHTNYPQRVLLRARYLVYRLSLSLSNTLPETTLVTLYCNSQARNCIHYILVSNFVRNFVWFLNVKCLTGQFTGKSGPLRAEPRTGHWRTEPNQCFSVVTLLFPIPLLCLTCFRDHVNNWPIYNNPLSIGNRIGRGW